MIKLRTDIIGLSKPVEIKLTVAKKMMANDIMIHALKGDLGVVKKKKDEEASATDEMVQDNAVLTQMLDFVQQILGLSNEQTEQLKNTLDTDDLTKYVNYIYFKTRGISDADADSLLSDSGEDEDPKKE